jgi:cardiolipin synthase
MKARIWTVPNQITFLRLGFLPFFLILILYEKYRWALLVLFVSAATDALDGLLARSLDQKSALGAYLDPIADKLLLSFSFIVLAMEKKIGWWLTILVISRDVLMLVVAAVILIIQGYRPFPPTLLGKATTFFEIALVFLTVYGAAYPNESVSILLHYIIYAVCVFVIVSGFHYCFVVARRLHHSS